MQELQPEVLGSFTPYRKSGFINHLPFTTIVMRLSENGKKFYFCFSLAMNLVSLYESRWGLSVLAIYSSASPEPASPFELCRP